ncbi:unnamed protein product [Oncorhynchus mykiss]|uniref:Uncharacterized protein n=1 Tax=Oncorhynchus mykiss TaxID=8022 RepID=A0A060Z4W3_ONCMY|nr:unnamed protein product [Oncorhynchus mykiss]
MNKVISCLLIISFQIFDLLPVKETTHIPYELEDPVSCLRVRPRRYVIPYPDGPTDRKNEPFEVFQNLGLKLATNLVIRVPSCLSYKGNEYHHSYGEMFSLPHLW